MGDVHPTFLELATPLFLATFYLETKVLNKLQQMTKTFPNSQVIASLLKEKKHGDKGEVR